MELHVARKTRALASAIALCDSAIGFIPAGIKRTARRSDRQAGTKDGRKRRSRTGSPVNSLEQDPS